MSHVVCFDRDPFCRALFYFLCITITFVWEPFPYAVWQFGRQPAHSVFEIELNGLRQAAVWGTSPPLISLDFSSLAIESFAERQPGPRGGRGVFAAGVLLDIICRHEEWKRTGLVGLLPADANGEIVTED